MVVRVVVDTKIHEEAQVVAAAVVNSVKDDDLKLAFLLSLRSITEMTNVF